MIFQNITPLRLAAFVAAMLFLALGVGMVFGVSRLQKGWTYLSFWNGWIHLLVFTVPMLLMRLAYWDLEFAQIELLGVKATALHNYSMPFYKWMLVGSVLDLVRVVTVGLKKTSSDQKAA